MKRSARAASFIIFLFFLLFNGFLLYLIVERVSETKSKYNFACTDALVSSLNEYNKLKAIDSVSMPDHAMISYSEERITVSRQDPHSVILEVPVSSIVTDTVDPASLDLILNSPSFVSIDLNAFEQIFKKALHHKKIQAGYRLDTITTSGRISNQPMLHAIWTKKRNKEFPYATRPVQIPHYSSFSVFAEFKHDRAFFKNDLLWPMLAFGCILLISNAALIFVYRTIRKQKRINEIKTDFINNITHEMKTPITIASAGLEALEHHIPPGERTRFYLHTSKKQLHLLNEFVERIVDAAVRDVSDFNLKKEKIDLHALFGELVQSYSVLPGKPVNFHLSGEGDVIILGDRLHLETAFHNIIDNAIKYSNKSVDINIDIVGNSRDITIKIRDNGMGIQPQFVKNIFEKFFRVPQGDAQSIKGFGLGLYYVSSIIKKHSGSISVQSKWKTGTEFFITLPKNA